MKMNPVNGFEEQVLAHLRPLQGQMVMLEADLAWFLGIEPDEIVNAIENHPECFPADFVFLLSDEELSDWQRRMPCLTANGLTPAQKRYAFTTHGTSMLLLAIKDKSFALSAIPVLGAFANYWDRKETAALSDLRRVNRKS